MSVTAAPASSGTRSTLSPSPSVPPPTLPPPQRSRTVLPPLSSLSLPGSPALGSTTPSLSPAAPPPCCTTLLQNELHHPRPTYPPRRPSEHLHPLLHTPSPPTSTTPRFGPSTQPDPEVYARAYALLRSKLLGPASSNSLAPSAQELRKVADAASAALLAKEKGEKGEKGQGELRKRRSRSWEESVLQQGGNRGEAKRVKKQGEEEEDVAFFDNAAPCFCPPSSSAAAAAQPQRHRSFSPPSSFPPTAPHLPPSSSSSRPSLLHLGRKRSFSLPPSSSFSSCAACPHPHPHPFSSLPASRSLTQLAAAGQARQEALRSVVKSFEAVRACRGDWGWRRLGGGGGGGAVEQQH